MRPHPFSTLCTTPLEKLMLWFPEHNFDWIIMSVRMSKPKWTCMPMAGLRWFPQSLLFHFPMFQCSDGSGWWLRSELTTNYNCSIPVTHQFSDKLKINPGSNKSATFSRQSLYLDNGLGSAKTTQFVWGKCHLVTCDVDTWHLWHCSVSSGVYFYNEAGI